MSNVLDNDTQQQVRALGRLGWTLVRIQGATGIERETSRGYLKAAGTAVRSRGWPSESKATPAVSAAVSSDAVSPPPGRVPSASACEPYREERKRLLDAAASNADWEHVHCAAVVAANTSLRPVDVKHLRRGDVDLFRKTLSVRRSKNESSHRVITLNASALNALARMFERADMLGHTEPERYL